MARSSSGPFGRQRVKLWLAVMDQNFAPML